MKNLIFYLFLLNSFISGSLLAEPFVVYEYSKNSSNNSNSQNFHENEDYRKDVIVAKWNCEDDKNFCRSFGVHAYPYIGVF